MFQQAVQNLISRDLYYLQLATMSLIPDSFSERLCSDEISQRLGANAK